jgi:hypothetical protein
VRPPWRAITGVIVYTSIVLVVALWLRSYFRLDVLSYVPSSGESRAIVSYRGAVHVISAGTNARPRGVRYDSYHVPAGATFSALHRSGSLRWRFVGFARIRTTPTVTVMLNGRAVTVTLPSGGLDETLPYGPSDVMPLVPWLDGSPYDALIVPWWFIALAAGGYPLYRAWRWTRAMYRRRHGHCAACGYDLRGSSGSVCPECGAPAVAPAPARAANGFVLSPERG